VASEAGLQRSSLGAGRLQARIHAPSWSADAWGAIALTAAFIGVSCWWLSVDRHVPIFDSGLHLEHAIVVNRDLGSGAVWEALTLTRPYPPFAYLIGALGIAIGGVGVAPPIIAENIVFVSLLALGCYHVGRLAFGSRAGLLAVVFALGSPMLTAQFHVFMIDAPETAMAAVSLWAILATERFSRVGASALAGLVVGLGMLTKEPLVLFVAGPALVTAIRGGRQAWRGFVTFLAVVALVAGWWYVAQSATISSLGTEATTAGLAAEGGVAPARGSPVNFEWYFWNILNSQLLLPLFLFAVIGWVWMLLGFLRRRPVSAFAPELAVGAFVAWLGITETFVHDNRYSMPMLVYLAVIGSFWIVRLPRGGSITATLLLIAIFAINTLGDTFGVGPNLSTSLPNATAGSEQGPGTFTLFSTSGYLVSAPEHEGNLLAVIEDLKRRGLTYVLFGSNSAVPKADFSVEGLHALATIAGLNPNFLPTPGVPTATWNKVAVVANFTSGAGRPPPCLRLRNGTGVWVSLGNPAAPVTRYYCPYRHPQLY
jgi:hypothetical protein